MSRRARLALGAAALAVACGPDRAPDTGVDTTGAAPVGTSNPTDAPPLPAPGAPDSLIALRTVPTDVLVAYETREHAYEAPAITVYGRQGDWLLVKPVAGGRAWLHASTAGQDLPIEQLVVNGLNYLTEAWDGTMRDAPSLTGPSRALPRTADTPAEVPANVVEARRADGTLWFRVEVLDKSPCTGDSVRVVARGWIRAWGRDGMPAAWFSSRGC